MLKLDNALLDELGLGTLPEDQKRGMLQHIYDTLEIRVGTNLANQMSDEQLLEFEKFMDAGGDSDKAMALQWLETNLPHYKQVVNEEFEKLKGEVKQMAPQIMAISAPAPVVATSDDGGFVTQQAAGVPAGTTSAAPQPYADPGYGAQPQAVQQPYATPQYAQAPIAPTYGPSQAGGMQQSQAQPYDYTQQQATPGAFGVPQQQQPQQQTWQQPMQQQPWPPQQPPAGPGGYPQ